MMEQALFYIQVICSLCYLNLSISLAIFWPVIWTQICVVAATEECPTILAIFSIGILASKVSVLKLQRADMVAQWSANTTRQAYCFEEGNQFIVSGNIFVSGSALQSLSTSVFRLSLRIYRFLLAVRFDLQSSQSLQVGKQQTREGGEKKHSLAQFCPPHPAMEMPRALPHRLCLANEGYAPWLHTSPLQMN